MKRTVTATLKFFIQLDKVWPAGISVWHGDAVTSPKLKNWPLFGQKFSIFGQSIQLHLRESELVSIIPTKAK